MSYFGNGLVRGSPPRADYTSRNVQCTTQIPSNMISLRVEPLNLFLSQGILNAGTMGIHSHSSGKLYSYLLRAMLNRYARTSAGDICCSPSVFLPFSSFRAFCFHTILISPGPGVTLGALEQA